LRATGELDASVWRETARAVATPHPRARSAPRRHLHVPVQERRRAGRRVDRTQPQPDPRPRRTAAAAALELQTAHLPQCPWCATRTTAAATGASSMLVARTACWCPIRRSCRTRRGSCRTRATTTSCTPTSIRWPKRCTRCTRPSATVSAQPAFNLWLHRVPGRRFHWHIELQPRTGQMAGLELGGDMYINSMPPEVTVGTEAARGPAGNGGLAPMTHYVLSAAQRRTFAEDGWVHLPGFLSRSRIGATGGPLHGSSCAARLPVPAATTAT
jgi:hypothetical protein